MKKVIFISLLSFYLKATPEDVAERCISIASRETVNSCKNFLRGMKTEKSYALRCIAEFVAEGMDIKDISISDYYDTTSKNPILNLMTYMDFPTMEMASHVLKICAQSKNPALELGASIARWNTSRRNVTSTIPEGVQAIPIPSAKPSQEEMEAAIQAIINGKN